MKKLNSNWYTQGKFGKRLRETLDRDNKNLYSKGRFPTKIRKEDLPKDYIEFRSRTISYLTGYLKTSGIQDIYYTYLKENHLFKDDYLYISYNGKIELEKTSYGVRCKNYDFCVCGGDNIPILLEIEKNSKVDTTEVRKKINEKYNWWKENEKEDYARWFKDENIEDIIEYYKKDLYK